MRTKIIIDTDPGMDDAQAVTMLLDAHRKKKVEVLAITTIAGNTSLENCTKNAYRILEAAKCLTEVPVYPGLPNALVKDFVREKPPFHGKDGFGEAEFDTPLPVLEVAKPASASLELVNIINKFPGEVILLAIGPLTNIAIAMSIDTKFTSKLKDFYIMGGNLTGVGNIVAAGEFNFYSDAEAAKVVLDRTQIPIKLIPLETCFECGAMSYNERIELGKTGTEIAKFFNKLDANIIRDQLYYKNWIAFDQIASVWLLDNLKTEANQTLNCKTEEILATVELSGLHTRGMLVRLRVNSRPKNIIAMKSMNIDAFKQYLVDLFSIEF